jgi:hypothetical protein
MIRRCVSAASRSTYAVRSHGHRTSTRITWWQKMRRFGCCPPDWMRTYWLAQGGTV